MCHHIENLARDHRARTELVTGKFISPAELNERFSSISREVRGTIAMTVLRSIPEQQGRKLMDWTGKSTKARPIPKGHSELMIFFALAAATPEGGDLNETINLIRNTHSAAGVLLPA
jgi:hypothetical protein